MNDLRENLGALIGTIVTTIGVAISWLISSQIFTTLIAVFLGFLASYFLQSMTQRKAWKRDYSIKIAETVYGVVYRDVKSLLQTLEYDEPEQLNFSVWREIQQDHRYFMVDEKFGRKLDDFFQEVESYSLDVWKLKNDVLPQIINEETQKFFRTKAADGITVRLAYKDGDHVVNAQPDFIRCLAAQIHPKDDIQVKGRPKREIVGLEMFFGQVPANLRDIQDFDKFWESCVKKMTENENYQDILRRKKTLLTETESIEKELERRIRQPWNI
jgi:hypothetical protein